jgi:hypothetical protein
MLLLHGLYRFAPRRVAYRNDFCISCGQERLAEQIRTFNMAHIFWLPVIPLGFWKSWACTVCRRDPHVSGKTRRSFKIAGAVLLALMAVTFWVVPPPEGEDVLMVWGFRVVLTLGFVATVASIVRQAPEPALAERLKAIAPNTNPTCPFCRVPLFDLPAWHCPVCKVRRL